MAEHPAKPNALVVRFGRELRRLRKQSGMSQGRVARFCGCSGSLVSSVELAKRVPQPDFAKSLDRLFETDGFFGRLAAYIAQPAASGPLWFQRWAEEIEPGAVALRTWEPLLIPGLLQTADYARALFRGANMSEERVEELTAIRMRRQQVLTRPDPPAVWVLMDEWVLKRPVGGPALMAAQLARLLELSELRHITIQLTPYDTRCYDGFMSGFILAELSEAPTIVSVDSAASDEVTADPTAVARAVNCYERIRAEAFRVGQSVDLIKKVWGSWKQQI
ncbi:helix-turn-helix domain-containing protein [Spongiactinospora sp. 9N601]|uniref:helix-turn-helix domain-containing protein n=1 Tax=Spongiactinospora sp. 9N601 TaxID=3375149 RepID=UPI00379AFDCB